MAGVATHPDGEVYVFQRGRHADARSSADAGGPGQAREGPKMGP